MQLSKNVIITKRICDIVIGFFGTIAFLSLYPLIALAIKWESRGPILYSQERIGINKRRRTVRAGKIVESIYPRGEDFGGRPFAIYKFRSMFTDAEVAGPQLCQKGHDPRVTRVGWWLRALHLDELPQFWNILKGDMSFIGPRPERAHFTLQFGKTIPHYQQRTLFVKPGLTGLAQVVLGYDDSLESVVRKTYYDYSYRASMGSFVTWIKMEAWVYVHTVGYLLQPLRRSGEVRDLDGLKRAKDLPFRDRNPGKGNNLKTSARINLQGSIHPIIVTDPLLDGPGRNLEIIFTHKNELEVCFTPTADFDLEDMGFLINLANKVKGIGGTISIKNSNPRIGRMIREIHLDKVVRIKQAPVSVVNFLTVDVECWFHAFNLKDLAPPSTWHQQETRVEANVEKILRLLEAHNTKATFFVLGWVADRFPDIVRMIDKGGHEIGTHGYYHMLITDMTPTKFEEDLGKSLETLAKLTSQRIIGHRASNFSVVNSTLWSLELMRKFGLEYDSSIFPIKRDRYGIPHYPNRLPHRILLPKGKTMAEFPMSTLGVGKKFLPMSGGGYLRLFPHQVTEKFIESKNQKGHPAMVYFHPWELDVDQKKLNAGMMKTFQHYVNLHTTEWKLDRLLGNFRFGSVRDTMQTKRVQSMLNRNPVRVSGGRLVAPNEVVINEAASEHVPTRPVETLPKVNKHIAQLRE